MGESLAKAKMIDSLCVLHVSVREFLRAMLLQSAIYAMAIVCVPHSRTKLINC